VIGKRFKEAWHDIFSDDSEHQTPLMAISGSLRAPTARDYRKAFNTPFSGVLAIAFGTLSLWLLFEAGGEMIQAMRPCTAEALQEGESWNNYQIPGPRGSHHSCYFYEIKGGPPGSFAMSSLGAKGRKIDAGKCTMSPAFGLLDDGSHATATRKQTPAQGGGDDSNVDKP
jgi:hypothetical protein